MKNLRQNFETRPGILRNEPDLITKPKIRCAIYTRKSREDGLDQAFNSLDNQRLAAENFIASQVNEGWVLNPDHYDDGAYSGGDTDRPAFQKLLKDIKEKKVNCVVVYKVERISRSNSDFIRMIEFFDEYKVNFVSVTESFNTGTASGRLMLGMLMNFAQYERELCSERVKYKIDASKKKGIWMGGTLPLGYDTKDGKLYINDEEAKIVRNIFNNFIETESALEVAKELNRNGFTTKSWISQRENLRRGKKFNQQNIRRIIQNKIYAGWIEHQGQDYEGVHEAIIERDVWLKANSIINCLQENRVIIPKTRVSSSPLLKGILKCGECGGRMIPTYTNKQGKRYRYYLCSAKSTGNSETCTIARVSATEAENIVTHQVLSLIKKPEFVIHAIHQSQNLVTESEVINSFQQIEKVWNELFPVEQARIISLLIKEIEVRPNGLNIRIFKNGLNSLSNELT